MSISKKGLRKITVDEMEYAFKVSNVKKKSNWRQQENELDDEFMRFAKYNGIGQVKDITINIAIHSIEHPVSNLFIKINTLLVNGFMGAEHRLQVTPKLVAYLVRKALEDGWKPSQKGDFRIDILDSRESNQDSVLLLLPEKKEIILNS